MRVKFIMNSFEWFNQLAAHHISLTMVTALFLCFPLTENNRTPVQRSNSRQNLNAGPAMVKTLHASKAHNEVQPSAARSKAAACSESGRRCRNSAAVEPWLDRERLVEREVVKPAEKEIEGETEPPVTAIGTALNSCSTNGESDVETLLAKLRAL